AFNSFFGVTSAKAFSARYGSIVDRFVPHPSYFNAGKIPQGQSWFEAILALDEVDRIVSFLSQTHDPHAFSVRIDEDIADYKVVTFNDITQSLIKRILIENKMNIDASSGAYTKQYFLHVKQSIEDAARFNEKHIGLTRIRVAAADFEPAALVQLLKRHTRDDDMIVSWQEDAFLVAYLVEDADKAHAVEEKLRRVANESLACTLTSIFQQDHESITKMLHFLAD
ncbi:MAG: hypothetical protein PHS10_05790, partial [Thiovulaceae bacterium]|nr:hypothetical protein [Sulfurimonadaceae bacterium]